MRQQRQQTLWSRSQRCNRAAVNGQESDFGLKSGAACRRSPQFPQTKVAQSPPRCHDSRDKRNHSKSPHAVGRPLAFRINYTTHNNGTSSVIRTMIRTTVRVSRPGQTQRIIRSTVYTQLHVAARQRRRPSLLWNAQPDYSPSLKS